VKAPYGVCSGVTSIKLGFDLYTGLCANVNRDTIRRMMHQWQKDGWKCWEGAETQNGGEKGENRNTILMWE